MKHLHIDIETYSELDIRRVGAYKYAMDPSFEVLLFAYQAEDDPVVGIDMAQGEAIPEAIQKALVDPGIIKHAHNAAFEWWCLNRAGYKTPLDQWQCSMIHGLYLGYPGGLGPLGDALGLEEDEKKETTGKALIRYFCNPCKPTKSNGGRQRNLPKHDPDRWALFKEYNAQDVVAEYEITKRLSCFPVAEEEWQAWRQDTRMCAAGVPVDVDLVRGALLVDETARTGLYEEAKDLTGLDNPNSREQLLAWVNAHNGKPLPDLTKDTVAAAIADESTDGVVRQVLSIRQQLGKTSVKKYQALDNATAADGRVRGLLQFYGANRTGRWAGRLVQVQNLPRNYISSLDWARKTTKLGDYKSLRTIYGNVPDTLSQLIRTAFIPSPGHHLIVSDFSAIEARILVWLAGEAWAQEVFDTTGKIYETTAARMFHVPIDTIEKGKENYHLRQKGKIATLALGYQGGANALIAMGALRMGIDEEELPEIVTKWRMANPSIEQMWRDVGEAALETAIAGRETYAGKCIFRYEADPESRQDFLTVELPSGRKLYYAHPEIGQDRWGRPSVTYMGVDQTKKKWQRIETYGGKLTENITQAVARDCLALTLKRIKAAGYHTLMHVHDEVIIDAAPRQRLEDVNAILSEPMPWAPGLTLTGAGFEAPYYMKD